jgi:hypothetical protein
VENTREVYTKLLNGTRDVAGWLSCNEAAAEWNILRFGEVVGAGKWAALALRRSSGKREGRDGWRVCQVPDVQPIVLPRAANTVYDGYLFGVALLTSLSQLLST